MLDLEQILSETWSTLQKAVRDFDDPYRTPVFASSSRDGVQVRTVVLRLVEPETHLLTFYTAYNSPKVSEIEQDSRVSWLFWSPVSKIQIRIYASAQIHYQDQIAREAWEKIKFAGRLNYSMPIAPGTKHPDPVTGLPDWFNVREPTEAEREHGWQNFAVINTIVYKVDWLKLAESGNLRAQFDWSSGELESTWLMP